MCIGRPTTPPPPPPVPEPPKEVFSETAGRVGNIKKAGVKDVGGQEQVRGRGLSALRLRNYSGMKVGY